MFKEYHTDMSMMEYLKLNRLSSSDIHNFSVSPYYYRKMKEKPLSTRYLTLGSAVHRILESRKLFDAEYVLRPEWVDLRTKEGKLWKSDIGNKIVLSEEEYYAILTLYNNFFSSEDTMIRMISCSEGMNEVVHLWEEDEVKCKCRTDRLLKVKDDEFIQYLYDNHYISEVKNEIVVAIDYKTSSDSIDYAGFSRTIRIYGYDLKAAHYVVGTECDLFMWVVLETTYPYQIARYMLSPERLESKIIERKRIIDRYKLCSFTGRWPMNEQDYENTLI